MPKRIQRKRTAGWHMPEGAIYVGRPTRWGNPYRVGATATVRSGGYEISIEVSPEMAVEAFRAEMDARLTVMDPADPEDVAYVAGWERDLAGLAGHDLACWCPLDQPCHADVLLELANGGA